MWKRDQEVLYVKRKMNNSEKGGESRNRERGRTDR